MGSTRRICINAASANAGGAVTYLSNVLPELATLGPHDRYLVIAPRSTLDGLSGVLDQACFETEDYPYPPVRQARRLVFDQLTVPRLCRRFGAQALFSSNGFGTLISGCPELLLVRNALYYSRLLEEKLALLGRSTRDLRLRRLLSNLSIRGSRAVVFPTQAMKERVEEYVPLRNNQSAVIPYGFDHDRFFSGASPGEQALAPLQAWRRQGRSILLYVSGYAVHKNFETAIEALAELTTAGVDTGLALTAVHKDWGEMAELDSLMARIDTLGLGERVHFTGEVPWAQLSSLYAAADLSLFPSVLESFGHPMVESMASGLPTVAADTAVNREILGESALYFDAFDPAACANQIRRGIEDSALAEQLRAAGLERARSHSWKRHAEGLHSLLAELADEAT